jgi:type IV pilus assembly protein PilE
MDRQRGVTLIELLTVIVVLGILTAIAVPAYTSYTTKVKRADAKVALSSSAQQLERCYTRFNSYSPAAPNPACITLPYNTPNGTYTIDQDAGAGGIVANAFYLQATPIGKQAQDTECGTFKLNSLNVQSVSTGSTTCW